MSVDRITATCILQDLKAASPYQVCLAFANLDKFPSLAEYNSKKQRVWSLYLAHDFKFDQSKMMPESKVCAEGFIKANTFDAILDVWDSVHFIDKHDVADNVWETVMRPFEIQLSELILNV